jgi:hypothetical protein
MQAKPNQYRIVVPNAMSHELCCSKLVNMHWCLADGCTISDIVVIVAMKFFASWEDSFCDFEIKCTIEKQT